MTENTNNNTNNNGSLGETSEATQRSPSGGTTASAAEDAKFQAPQQREMEGDPTQQLFLDPSLDTTHSSAIGHIAMPDMPVGYTPTDMYSSNVNQANVPPLQTQGSFMSTMDSPGNGLRHRAGTTGMVPVRQDAMASEAAAPQSLHHDLLPHPFASPHVLDDSHTNSSDMLQFWLSHADSDMGYAPLSMTDMNHASYGQMSDDYSLNQLQDESVSQHATESASAEQIPQERFLRVENCWLASSSKLHLLMPSLWYDVAGMSGPNLFSDGSRSSNIRTQSNMTGSRWGIDRELYQRLKTEFNPQSPPVTSPGTAGAPSNPKAAFPPPEVLDICLDMHFRQFQPMAHFIHAPTFEPASTPLFLLYTMCLLGLSALGTSSGRDFIKHAFTVRHRHRRRSQMFGGCGMLVPVEQMCWRAAQHSSFRVTAASRFRIRTELKR